MAVLLLDVCLLFTNRCTVLGVFVTVIYLIQGATEKLGHSFCQVDISAYSLPSNTQYLSCDACLEVERADKPCSIIQSIDMSAFNSHCLYIPKGKATNVEE